MVRKILLVLFLFSSSLLFSQNVKKALFIGNSYTYTNNLPQLIAQIADSMGDSLIYDSNTPGGYTFESHSTNSTTINKMQFNDWDVVVLQEQSQLPSFPPSQVQSDVYPYAYKLDSMAHSKDTCTKTMFFMTWGRENGDQSNCAFYTPLCTYEGMQQRLYESYTEMGDMFDAEVSPVGIVWREVRRADSTIQLYNADESHPNINGSYLAACTFYAALFHRSPVGAYYPGTVNMTNASLFQQMAEKNVVDSFSVWNIDTSTYVQAKLDLLVLDTCCCQMGFNMENSSINADEFLLNFGDGTILDSVPNSYHYADTGTYTVSLIAKNGCLKDSFGFEFHAYCNTSSLFDNNFLNPLKIVSNPVNSVVSLGLDGKCEYQIFNILGKEVLSGISNDSRLDVADLNDGVYNIFILNEGKYYKSRFIKLH